MGEKWKNATPEEKEPFENEASQTEGLPVGLV